jgi:hypothetical protein
MTQNAEEDNKSLGKTTGNITGVGLIGAWLTSSVESYAVNKPIDEPTKNLLLLCVPFVSICIVEIVKWAWEVISPQSANQIKLRRELNKTEKQIKKDLVNPLYSEEHKIKLKQKLEDISLKRIESFNEK